MGYAYDSLQRRAPQRMEAAPTLALFAGIDKKLLGSEGFSLHVFLYASEAAADADAPPAGPLDAVLDHPALAGTGSIFGGQLGDCPNCEGGLPFNLKVDVSKRLLQLGVSRRAAAVRVVVHTGDGVWRSLDETPLPAPELVGPYFASPAATPPRRGGDGGGRGRGAAAAAGHTRYPAIKSTASSGPDGGCGEGAAARGLPPTGVADGPRGAPPPPLRRRARRHVAGRRAELRRVRRSSTLAPSPGYLNRGKLLTETAAVAEWSAASASPSSACRPPGRRKGHEHRVVGERHRRRPAALRRAGEARARRQAASSSTRRKMVASLRPPAEGGGRGAADLQVLRRAPPRTRPRFGAGARRGAAR